MVTKPIREVFTTVMVDNLQKTRDFPNLSLVAVTFMIPSQNLVEQKLIF